jgi:hypothetical protein
MWEGFIYAVVQASRGGAHSIDWIADAFKRPVLLEREIIEPFWVHFEQSGGGIEHAHICNATGVFDLLGVL